MSGEKKREVEHGSRTGIGGRDRIDPNDLFIAIALGRRNGLPLSVAIKLAFGKPQMKTDSVEYVRAQRNYRNDEAKWLALAAQLAPRIERHCVIEGGTTYDEGLAMMRWLGLFPGEQTLTLTDIRELPSLAEWLTAIKPKLPLS